MKVFPVTTAAPTIEALVLSTQFTLRGCAQVKMAAKPLWYGKLFVYLFDSLVDLIFINSFALQELYI